MKNLKVGTKIEITKDGLLNKGSKHKIYYVGSAEPGTGGAAVSGAKEQYIVRHKKQNIILDRNEFKVIK